MANNPVLFDGALAGAAGGALNRWITSNSASNYTSERNTALALARAVDAAIPVGSFTDQEGQLLQALVLGIITSRHLESANQSDYVSIGAAIAACFNTVRAALIVIPSDGPLVSPVYIENYLPAAGNDLRTAMINALTANPNAVTFVFPGGSYNWVGSFITETQGLRNNLILQGQNTVIVKNQGGIPGGQNIFWFWSNPGATNIHISGFDMQHLNANTSLSSYAIGIEQAVRCSIKQCRFLCTLQGSTLGGNRWGASFFGSTDCIMDDIVADLAELGMCSQGRSCLNAQATNLRFHNANDVGISISTGHSSGLTLRSISVSNIEVDGVSGSLGVFIGTDGVGTGIGCDLLQDVIIDGVQLVGIRNPDLTFAFGELMLIAGGLITENIIINNVNTRMGGIASGLGRTILIASQDDETSWKGLVVSNVNGTIPTDATGLPGLYIQGHNMSEVQIDNVYMQGNGIYLADADGVTINNCNIADGQIFVEAINRNLTLPIRISDSTIIETGTVISPAIFFRSLTGRNIDYAKISDCTLRSSTDPIRVTLTGGTFGALVCSDVDVTFSDTLNAEALATLQSSNCIGLTGV